MQTADITEQKVIVRQAIAELLHFFNEAEATGLPARAPNTTG